MNQKQRWTFLDFECFQYCKDRNIKPNWSLAGKLCKDNGYEFTDKMYFEDGATTSSGKVTEWKPNSETPQDRTKRIIIQAHEAYLFESNRTDDTINKYWFGLYASQKKELFELFEYLQKVSPEGYEKYSKVQDNVGLPSVTEPYVELSTEYPAEYYDAENVIKDLIANPVKVKMGLHANPWFNKLPTKLQAKLFTEYPEYINIQVSDPVLRNKYNSFFSKLSEAVQ